MGAIIGIVFDSDCGSDIDDPYIKQQRHRILLGMRIMVRMEGGRGSSSDGRSWTSRLAKVTEE